MRQIPESEDEAYDRGRDEGMFDHLYPRPAYEVGALEAIDRISEAVLVINRLGAST